MTFQALYRDRDSAYATDYSLQLNEYDTERWVMRWPGSVLAGVKIAVEINANGLESIQCRISGQPQIPKDELEALISYYLPPIAQHLWPTWEKLPA